MLFPTKYSSSLDLYSPGTLYRDGKSTIKRHLFLKATSPVPPALTITVLWPKAELPPKESYIPRERDPIPASIHRFFDLNLNSLMKFSPALADINVAVNYVYYVLIDPFLQYPEHFLTPSREGIRNLLEGDEGAGIRELLMSCCLQRAYTRIRRLEIFARPLSPLTGLEHLGFEARKPKQPQQEVAPKPRRKSMGDYTSNVSSPLAMVMTLDACGDEDVDSLHFGR